MSGTWHDTRGYPPRPFPYRDPSPSGNTTNKPTQNGHNLSQTPYSPSHAVLSSVPSNASSVYVIDGSERMNHVKGPSSIGNGKCNGAQETSTCTFFKISLVVVFWILLAALTGGIVYFILAYIDISNDQEPTQAPALQMFAGTFTLPASQFSAALNDESSDEYQQFSNDVTESLDDLYSSESQNYIGSEVVGFSEGSIIVDYILNFRAPSPSAAEDDTASTYWDVMTIFQNAVNEAQGGEMLFAGVDPDSVVIEEVINGHHSTSGPFDTDMPSRPDEGLLSTESTTRATTTTSQTLTLTTPTTSGSTTGVPEHTTVSPTTSSASDPTTKTSRPTTEPELTQSVTISTLHTSRPTLECGTRIMQKTQRIIGGQTTYQGKWPWLVSLQTRHRHFCGGVIIGDIWILTAAHCLYKSQVGTLSVYINSTTIDHEDGYYAAIDGIYMHPDYNDDVVDYDIALLRLRRRLVYSETVFPICLETIESDNMHYDECFIAGWGSTESDGYEDSASDELLDAQVPVIPRTVCTTYMEGITERMICAGYDEGGIDSCAGDSGGPLMCPSDNGNWHVTGITSWGIGCALPRLPGVYANVSMMTSWVFDTMRYWYENPISPEYPCLFCGNTPPCTSGYFECTASGICIPDYHMCDGYVNCPRIDDEVNCDYCTEITEPMCLDVLPYNMKIDFSQIYNSEYYYSYYYSMYEDNNTLTEEHLAALASCHPNALAFMCSYLFKDCPLHNALVPCQEVCYSVTSACIDELNDIAELGLYYYEDCESYPSSKSASEIFCELQE